MNWPTPSSPSPPTCETWRIARNFEVSGVEWFVGTERIPCRRSVGLFSRTDECARAARDFVSTGDVDRPPLNCVVTLLLGKTMKNIKPEKRYCSRLATTKKAAEKIAAKMRAVGGVAVTITGQRGAWRVRGKFEVARFARFCADEAKHEQSK